jgi:hypothetical protein
MHVALYFLDLKLKHIIDMNVVPSQTLFIQLYFVEERSFPVALVPKQQGTSIIV